MRGRWPEWNCMGRANDREAVSFGFFEKQRERNGFVAAGICIFFWSTLFFGKSCKFVVLWQCYTSFSCKSSCWWPVPLQHSTAVNIFSSMLAIAVSKIKLHTNLPRCSRFHHLLSGKLVLVCYRECPSLLAYFRCGSQPRIYIKSFPARFKNIRNACAEQLIMFRNRQYCERKSACPLLLISCSLLVHSSYMFNLCSYIFVYVSRKNPWTFVEFTLGRNALPHPTFRSCTTLNRLDSTP